MTDNIMEELDTLLDSKELAVALRRKVKTIYNLHCKGILVPRIFIGRNPLYDLKESLERYERYFPPSVKT